MPLSSSPSTQRRRVGGRGMLVNSIHGVDTLRYVVVHSGLSYTCFTEVLSSYAIIYRLSTSNHNLCRYRSSNRILSYIVFLHQTTTRYLIRFMAFPLSYIVFLHQTTTYLLRCSHIRLLSYIVFLHQTTTAWRSPIIIT